MDALKKFLKNPVNAFKALIDFIIRICKFFGSVLGQIVGWIIIIILAIVVIYVIIDVISSFIADILGIDQDAGIDQTADYEIIQQLVSEGYDTVMPPEELVDYYAYEYAVLMDLARNIEEAGVFYPTVDDQAYYDPALLTKDEWAQLCADTFVTFDRQLFTKGIKDKYTNIKTNAKTALDAGIDAANDGKSVTDVASTILSNLPSNAALGIDDGDNSNNAQVEDVIRKNLADKLALQAMAEAEDAKPSNEMSKNELIYKSVTSDSTKETSLMPYFVLERPVSIYKYRFIDTSLPAGVTEKDYSTIFRSSKGNGYTTNNISFGAVPTNSLSSGYTWQYISEYIRPLTANGLLNENNIALHRDKAGSTQTQLDIKKPYGEGIYYAQQDDGAVTYEIPLKTLADRYMPKAVLFSSWYLLKQDETAAEGEKLTADLILEEIRRIYDKACLDGETVPETNWLLVKDVLTTEKPISPPNTSFEKVFERTDMSTQNAKTEYAFMDGKTTELIYQRYNANFDSRTVTEKSKKEIGAAPNNNQNPAQTPPQATLFETEEQNFDGTLKEEIIDDLRLAITHHADKRAGFINDIQYEKYMEDFEKILEDNLDLFDLSTLSISNKPKEYIIYKRNESGEYIINCEKMISDEAHHSSGKSGTTHEQKYEHEFNSDECYTYAKVQDAGEHKDPYSKNEKCFVPYIKVMFGAKKVGVRKETKIESGKEYSVESDVVAKSTIISILDGNSVEYLYRVDSNEIEDIGSLTNNESFMKFDRYDMEMTNFGDWNEENNAKNLNDRLYFVVSDLFEARPLKLDNINDCVTLQMAGRTSGKIGDVHIEWTDANGTHSMTGLSNWLEKMVDMNAVLDTQSVKNAMAGMEAVPKGSLGIVRHKDPSNGEYDLTPPTNAAPASGYTFPANCSFSTGGQSEALSTGYINMKNFDQTKIDNLVKVIRAEIVNNVLDNIETFYNSKNGEIWFEKAGADGTPVKDKIGLHEFTSSTVVSNVSESDLFGEEVALFTVDERITTIEQTVKQRKMTMYLPRSAETWSSVKSIKNTIETNGSFDPKCDTGSGGYFQLIPRTSAGGGVKNIDVGVTNYWRTKFYAPHFSVVRESDVLAMISEWETAGDKGHFAAYTYIRDLYSLIHTAKSLKDAEGVPYVNVYSYEYMYIPDEILYFDERITDKAFWLERILATAAQDSIKKEENATMRNKRSVKTWQVLEYDKYEECYELNANGEPTGVVNVYGLWPLGGYLGRSLYAFEANSSDSANQKILSWGAYIGPGVHSGVDLYGRGNSTRLYNNIFDKDGNAKIKAKYNGGNVILTDGTNSVTIDGNGSVASFGDENLGVGTEGNHEGAQPEPTVAQVKNSGNINGSKGQGAYMSTTVPIEINGTRINFAGSTAATYGYELYRLTKAYGDGEKAEKELKETIQKEMLDTPVVAIAPGIVEEVKGGARPGFMVVIRHAEGVKTNYLHMKRWPEVQKGEYVGAGTILGYEGTTGNSGGYHVHHEINTNKGGTPSADGIKTHPIPQLYPFFNPFYNEKEASDAGYALENEYMSIVRTVFPYGAIVSGNDVERKFNYKSTNDGVLKQVENDSDSKLIMKNYTPTFPLMSLAELVADPNDQKAKLIERIGTQMLSQTQTSYSGDGVVAMPHYFDEEFISEVLSNGGHMLKPQATP